MIGLVKLMFRVAMRLLLIAVGCVFQLLPFALAPVCYAADPSDHDKLNALIDREWQYQLHEFPEQATRTGDRRFNDRLTNFSAAAFERRAAHDRAALSEIRAISPIGLTAEDKLNLAL